MNTQQTDHSTCEHELGRLRAERDLLRQRLLGALLEVDALRQALEAAPDPDDYRTTGETYAKWYDGERAKALKGE